MFPVPRELTSAAEIIANRKAVRYYFRTRPAWAKPEAPPAPPPTPLPERPIPAPVPPPLVVAAEETTWVRPKAHQIRDMVARRYGGLTRAEIEGPCRLVSYVKARHIAMYLCMRYAGMTSPQVGRIFGNRDHSTVISAVHKVARRIDSDPQYAADVGELTQQIAAWSGGTIA